MVDACKKQKDGIGRRKSIHTIVRSAKRLNIYKYDFEGDTNSDVIPTPANVKRKALGVFHRISADSSGKRIVKKNRTITQYSVAVVKYTTLGTVILLHSYG